MVAVRPDVWWRFLGGKRPIFLRGAFGAGLRPEAFGHLSYHLICKNYRHPDDEPPPPARLQQGSSYLVIRVRVRVPKPYPLNTKQRALACWRTLPRALLFIAPHSSGLVGVGVGARVRATCACTCTCTRHAHAHVTCTCHMSCRVRARVGASVGLGLRVGLGLGLRSGSHHNDVHAAMSRNYLLPNLHASLAS